MDRPSLIRRLRSHRVAVLKGGWSQERSISLKTGSAMEASLRRLKIPFISIDVKKDISTVLQQRKPTFCFIGLHGPFGEDGGIQSLLDMMNIGYTGSDAISSSLAMNKANSKVLFQENNVATPPWIVIKKSDFLSDPPSCIGRIYPLFKKPGVFIKPNDQGSAIGISYVQRKKNLSRALRKCFRESEEALVELCITGRELTVGILGKKLLPIIEIIPTHAFYDFHSKYARGGSKHILPATLRKEQENKVFHLAKKAFDALGCVAYGRVDIMLQRNGSPTVLEVNTIPGMTATSLLPEAAAYVGINFDDLMLKIAGESIKRWP